MDEYNEMIRRGIRDLLEIEVARLTRECDEAREQGTKLADGLHAWRDDAARLTAVVEAVKALHVKAPDVWIGTIHRGTMDVYSDGCRECGVSWPCDTIAALVSASSEDEPLQGPDVL